MAHQTVLILIALSLFMSQSHSKSIEELQQEESKNEFQSNHGEKKSQQFCLFSAPKYWNDLNAADLLKTFSRRENRNVAKNIILFVGDGMSSATIAGNYGL